MPHSGEELGGDLVDMYEAGQYKLKPLAHEFRMAAGRIELPDQQGYNYFRSDELGGPYGTAKPAWEALRNELFEVLKTTAANVEDVGDALCLAVKLYGEQDADAAAAFTRDSGAVENTYKNDEWKAAPSDYLKGLLPTDESEPTA